MINIIVHKNAVKYRGTEKEMKPISEYLKENYKAIMEPFKDNL